MKKWVWVKRIAVLAAVCLLATAFFALLYQYDNKYTSRAAITQENVTIPDANTLSVGNVTWLVEGWDLWPDSLLSPKDLSAHASVPVHIGQYFSLSPFHLDGSPHGQATWRLRLQGRGEYDLLLPEILCASAVYVDGVFVGGAGQVKPYAPLVQDLVVSLTLSGETELVIHTASYNHYYSGITYPPALGTPDAIARLTAGRMLIYGFFCFSSLAIALFSVAVWLGTPKRREDRLTLWFGLLALAFALRICYPFVRFFGVPVIRPLYALEDAMSMLMMWCALRITLSLCGMEGRRWAGPLVWATAGFVVLGATVPLLLPLLPAFTPIYGQLLFWYKLLASLAMTALALYGGVRAKSRDPWLLSGTAVYSVSLLAHVLCLGSFEPAYTLWQDEWGAYALVLCFAVLMVRRNFTLVQEHARLTNHLQEEVEKKTADLSRMLGDRQQLLAGFAHDLKTPMTSMNTFARLVEEGGVGLDEETRGYLGTIRRKTEEMRGRLEKMQEFAIQDAQSPQRERVDLVALLKRFYEDNLPDTEVAGVSFHLKLPRQAAAVRGDPSQLLRVLQNLVYNAVSFTPPDGTVTLSLRVDGAFGTLEIRDTGCGIAPEDLPRVFNQSFSRRGNEDGAGLGLYISQCIIKEHGGTIAVASEPGRGTVFTILLPLNQQ